MADSQTARDQKTNALRGSEAQFRSFFESMDQGYILVDVIVDAHEVAVDLLYVDANAAAIKMTGTELVGRRTRELSSDFGPQWFETFGRVAKTGVRERHEFTAGQPGVWYEFYAFKVGTADTRRVAAVFFDITTRKRADATLRESEEQLRRAHDELETRVQQRTAELAHSNAALEGELRERRAAEQQISALLGQLVTIQEEERRRIARDIHDQLGQQMTALRMNLEALQLRAFPQPALAGPIGTACKLAAALDQSIDSLAWQLRPAVLEHLGLADALGHFVSGWSQRFHIAADYDAAIVTGPRLSIGVETNLYRVAQEALHNIYKHAGASRVTVRFEQRDGGALLVIEDDGRGFDLADARRRAGARGLGLINMRERAALVAGVLEIESAVGRGTVVRVRVPVHPIGA